jgi:transcription elongation factor Elf1
MPVKAAASPKKATVQVPAKAASIKPTPVKPAPVKGKVKPLLRGSVGGRAAAAREEAEAHAEKDSQIEAFCPRCKTETTHKVSVMLGPKIRRVRCTVCGTEHNYHRSQLLKLRSVRDEIVQAKRRKVEESESKGLEKMYEEQMIGRDPKLAKPFSIKDKYYLEDLVNHPIFGAGLVTRIKEDGKIEVLFKSGLRLLVHNRFAATGAKKA